METNKVQRACIKLVEIELSRCQDANKIILQSIDRIGDIIYFARYLVYCGVLSGDEFDSIKSIANTAMVTIYRIGVEQ